MTTAIQGLKSAYCKAQQEHAELEMKIKKLKEQAKVYPSWIEYLVQPLADILGEHYGLQWEIYGPFGLDCETSIYLRKDMSKSICDQPVYGITLYPGNLDKGELLFKSNDKEILPLPDDLESIYAIIDEYYKKMEDQKIGTEENN